MVSIILPVYNCQNYIGKAIESVLRQTYHNWELLIVDDGSTDRSPEIVRQYATGDPRIQVFTRPNGGVSRARNTALEKVRGRYVALLDADDWLPEHSLEVRVQKFKESSDIAFVDGRVDVYNDTGDRIERSWKPTFRGNPYHKLLRLSPTCFFGPTWMVRLQSGRPYRFDERLNYAEDLFAYVEQCRYGGNYDFVDDTIYCYRNRAASAMKNYDGLGEGYLTLRRILVASKLPQPVDRLVFEYKIKRIMFLTYMRSGNFKKALQYLLR
jgi:glycosyltransferase involved in cell wall biosynthesis